MLYSTNLIGCHLTYSNYAAFVFSLLLGLLAFCRLHSFAFSHSLTLILLAYTFTQPTLPNLFTHPPTFLLPAQPSTGLDPVACRHMWRLLSRIAAARTTAMVLTTHNMLECEAVCTRVGIMKLGQLVCLGDNLHLRSTHGSGFLLEMSLQSPALGDAAKEVRYYRH